MSTRLCARSHFTMRVAVSVVLPHCRTRPRQRCASTSGAVPSTMASRRSISSISVCVKSRPSIPGWSRRQPRIASRPARASPALPHWYATLGTLLEAGRFKPYGLAGRRTEVPRGIDLVRIELAVAIVVRATLQADPSDRAVRAGWLVLDGNEMRRRRAQFGPTSAAPRHEAGSERPEKQTQGSAMRHRSCPAAGVGSHGVSRAKFRSPPYLRDCPYQKPVRLGILSTGACDFLPPIRARWPLPRSLAHRVLRRDHARAMGDACRHRCAGSWSSVPEMGSGRYGWG
jgi:hypothetical protein